MKLKNALIFIAGFVVGVAVDPSIEVTKWLYQEKIKLSSPTERILLEVQQRVRNYLKDPDSARFTNMQVFHPWDDGFGDMTAVCGFVNARSTFGGYTGRQPFIVRRTKIFLEEAPDEENFKRDWSLYCQ